MDVVFVVVVGFGFDAMPEAGTDAGVDADAGFGAALTGLALDAGFTSDVDEATGVLEVFDFGLGEGSAGGSGLDDAAAWTGERKIGSKRASDTVCDGFGVVSELL